MILSILMGTIAFVALSTIGGVHGNFSYEFAPFVSPLLLEGSTSTFNLSVQGITEDVLIRVKSSNEDVFQIVGDTEFPLRTREQVENDSIPVTIKAKFIGVATIEFNVQTKEIFSESPYQIPNYDVKSGAGAQSLKLASTYLLLAWLCLSYATMGTTIKWSMIRPRICRPHGIIIGIACQFIIMPLSSFLIAKGLGLEPRPAVGLILVGTCPGGWLSNVFTALLNCDLVLSITMTFISTVLALGLMPLNLHLYAKPIIRENERLEPPFRDLITQLAALIIPVFVGIFVSYKFPKVGEKISKLVKPFSAFIIIVSIGAGIPANLYLLKTPATIWIAAALLPVAGGLLGFFIAKLTCLANKSAVTVALETGSQNSFLAISIATLSYGQPESDLISLVPILVAIVTMIEGSAILLIYLCMTKFPGRAYEGEGDDDENREGESSCVSFRTCRRGPRQESPHPSEVKDSEPQENGNVPSSSHAHSADFTAREENGIQHSPSHVNPAYSPPEENGFLHTSTDAAGAGASLPESASYTPSISGDLDSDGTLRIKYRIYV